MARALAVLAIVALLGSGAAWWLDRRSRAGPAAAHPPAQSPGRAAAAAAPPAVQPVSAPPEPLASTPDGAAAGPPGGAAAGPADGAAAFALETHYAYILAAQRPSGAIALTPDSPDINPYFANLAARALATDPARLPAVRRYLEWYLARLNADATIDDHRVGPDGDEVPLGRYDSADSYAATYLSLVAAYVEAGGDLDWVARHRADLDRVAAVMDRLTDRDGLTWAKPLYPLKLLMDNSEVYRGWIDWARVLEQLDDAPAAARARRRAGELRDGLGRFRMPDGSLAWALAPLGLRRGPAPARFYPDGVAQFFPLVFGLTDDPGGYLRFRAAHPDWTDLTGDRFPWMLAALAAHRAGDGAAASAALATAAARHGDLAFPWYVTESAWVIRLLVEREQALPVPPGGARPR